MGHLIHNRAANDVAFLFNYPVSLRAQQINARAAVEKSCAERKGIK